MNNERILEILKKIPEYTVIFSVGEGTPNGSLIESNFDYRKMIFKKDIEKYLKLIIEETSKEIFGEIEKLIEKYFIEKPDDYDGIADIDGFLEGFIKIKKKVLK